MHLPCIYHAQMHVLHVLHGMHGYFYTFLFPHRSQKYAHYAHRSSHAADPLLHLHPHHSGALFGKNLVRGPTSALGWDPGIPLPTYYVIGFLAADNVQRCARDMNLPQNRGTAIHSHAFSHVIRSNPGMQFCAKRTENSY